MQFLEYLSNTGLVLWVAESNYGYPIILTLHSLGMALVIGIMLIADLRVLGVAKAISFSLLKQFFVFAWIGLAINVGSGTLLFLANYSAFLSNTAFLTKITFLIIGAILSYFLVREINVSQTEIASPKAKSIAFVCIVLWLGAITAGRIVGYTAVPF